MVSEKIAVGFDVSQTGGKKAGCGYFAYALVNAIEQHYKNIDLHLFPHIGDFYFDSLMPRKNPFEFGNYGPRFQNNFQLKKFWNDINLEKYLEHLDILHVNNFWCPQQLNKTRLICTIYDLGFIENYHWTTESNRIGCFEGAFKSSFYADGILAISEYTKQYFLKIFPHYPKERIQVIYPCSRFQDQTIKLQPKRLRQLSKNQFWLSIGTIEPRKNLKFMVEVYAEYLKSDHPKYPLVIVGQNGWLMNDFQDYLKQLEIEQHVIFLGYVSDEELIWLYQNCFVNLYPSLFEGFGLPVLEALQFGAPTLTNQNTSMDEIIYSEGSLLTNDKNTWLKAMIAFHENVELRNTFKIKGYECLKKFNWKKSADQTYDFYQKIRKLPKFNQ